MTAVDELVDEGLGTRPEPEPPAEDDWTGHPMDRPGLFVCEETGEDGTLCGKSFETRRKLAGHVTATHRFKGNLRGAKKADEAPSRSSSQTKTTKKTTKKAAAQATPVLPDGFRSSMYATSITAAALIVHLAAGNQFDSVDLDIVTKGAPGLGDALDAVGEKHEAVRSACDAILGGASGAVYIQLFIAVSAIAVPILAHHGLLPPSTGERFAAVSGAMVPPPVVDVAAPPSSSSPPSPGEQPPDERPSPDTSTWTMDEWRTVLFQVPPRVMSDIMQEAGIAPTAPPVTVDIPDFSMTMGNNGAASGTDDATTDDAVPTAT